MFVPVYVRTNTGDPRTVPTCTPSPTRSLAAPLSSRRHRARGAGRATAFEPNAEFRQRVHENIVRTMERRVADSPGASTARASTAPADHDAVNPIPSFEA